MQDQINEEMKFNQDKNNLYNMIISINSMKQLTNKGWEVKINSRTFLKEYLDKMVALVSVLGNKNSGKSFILHLLTGKEIPNGFTVTTEGLSFIIPDNDRNKDDNFILIDTAGTESPLLYDDDEEKEEKGEKKENKDKNQEETKSEEELKKKEEEEEKKIVNIVKDRQITDYFIQKFILEKSDIFICVVDNLTLTDQKFINRIIKYYTNKKIFIVHNLKTFIKKNQVEEYIRDTLLQSLTFDLEKVKFTGFEKHKYDKEEKNIYYYKQKLKEANRIIIHLIIANKDSEAGSFYNNFAIDYLNRQLRQVKEKKPFDIIKNLKEFLITISGDIFKTKLEPNSIVEDEKFIKLNTQTLELKDCSIDELGNNIITETIFKPKYRYGYYVDPETKQNKLFLELELYGKWIIEQKIETKEADFIIYVKGTKEKAYEKGEYVAKNYLPGNEFNLEIKVKNDKGFLNEPTVEEENGLYILTYVIRENNKEEDIPSEEGEEDEDV